jgi:Domain of unknown function (DUF4261)
LWFNLRFYKGQNYDKDREIICQTSGLTVFMGRELECGPYAMEPSQLGLIVQGLGRYVLTTGKIFNDKDTMEFGSGPNERAEISYEASSYGGLAPVMRVLIR